MTDIYKCNVCTKINSNSNSNSSSNSNSNSNSNSLSRKINVNSLLKPYNASKVTTLRSKKELPRLKQSKTIKKKATFMKKCHEVRSNSNISGKTKRTQDTKDRCKNTKDENGNQCVFSSKNRCKKRN
jgi:hypothetical protein